LFRNRAGGGFACVGEGDKGRGVEPGEYALNADADEIAVLTVVRDPVLDLLLVGEGDFAGVDRRGAPAVGELAAGK